MKSKIIGVLVAAAALTTGCATEQAKPQCLVGAGDFIVKYYPKDDAAKQCAFGDDAASQGELLSVQRYPSVDGAAPTAAFRLSAYLGYLGTQTISGDVAPSDTLDEDFVDAWYSGVEFATTLNSDPAVAVAQFDESDAPNAENFCRVSDFGFSASATELTAPTEDASNFVEVPVNPEDPSEGTHWILDPDFVAETLQGEQSAEYAFKNVEFYVTTRSPGVTFRGDLTLSLENDAGTCTGEYTVVGLAPSFDGANTCATDADCDPCGYGPDGSYVGGTGILPDLDIVCDPDLYGGYCFLRETTAGEAPVLPAFLDDASLDAFNERCQANQRGEG